MKKLVVFASVLIYAHLCAQKNDPNQYIKVYPIGDDPNVCVKSSYVAEETILFEATPSVRFSFYNDFIMNNLGTNRDHTQAWYVHVKPHLRMYTDNSLPVKTPSYRVFLGTQQLFRFGGQHFWGFSLESGHYSNGQSGAAFSEVFDDGSRQSDSIYATITPSTDLSSMLNRRSGNFSTNLTELLFALRMNGIDDDFIPYQTHSLKAGVTIYHDRFLGIAGFGGFSDNDIKIYGRLRIHLGYEFVYTFNKGLGTRIAVSDNFEVISGAHPSVDPIRNEIHMTWYPFKKSNDFGFFVGFITGHDNYNFRFLDSGNQWVSGIKWSLFPPIAVKGV